MRFATVLKVSMESDSRITVEVCYVAPELQFLRKVELASGSTILQAIVASGVQRVVPDPVDAMMVGIYSKLKKLDTVLKQSDRVEIYRPLLVDPMTARRARANKKR
jgi:putative ubiquitin-RnfH superfamily antitoxin RatB of RatAB toxin-antitoxin module